MVIEEGGSTPAADALQEFAASLDALVTVVDQGGLDHCNNPELLEFMRTFETIRNRLSLVDHRVLRDAETHGLAEFFGHGRIVDFVSSTLRISRAEASRRVKASAALGDRVSMLGQPLPPLRPTLAAVQRAGEVSAEQVSIIETALTSVDLRGFDTAAIEAGEKLLTRFATTFGPKDLRILAAQVVNGIDPDGTRPLDDVNHDRRHLTIRQHPDGSYVGEFRLTGAVGAKLTSILSPLAAPIQTTVPDRHGTPGQQMDQRTYPQRLHDALDDACSRLLRAGGLPASGGTPATVIVTIDHASLLTRSGFGQTTAGAQLSAAEVLRLAAEAEVLPAVLATSGAVLDLGRSRRIATATQTMALVARDGGCSFPGCSHPPEWSERHHMVAWIDGGATSVDNLTLLCGYHHANFVSHGWSCRLNPAGVPEWIPPRYIDRQQRPLINTRIARRIQQQELLRQEPDSDAA